VVLKVQTQAHVASTCALSRVQGPLAVLQVLVLVLGRCRVGIKLAQQTAHLGAAMLTRLVLQVALVAEALLTLLPFLLLCVVLALAPWRNTHNSSCVLQEISLYCAATWLLMLDCTACSCPARTGVTTHLKVVLQWRLLCWVVLLAPVLLFPLVALLLVGMCVPREAF
jgi:hypothetical protein